MQLKCNWCCHNRLSVTFRRATHKYSITGIAAPQALARQLLVRPRTGLTGFAAASNNKTSLASSSSLDGGAAPARYTAASDEFDQYYPAIEQYLSTQGKMPSVRTVAAGLPVGEWAKRFCQEFRQGLVQQQQAHKMEALPGWRWGGKSGYTYMPFEQHAARLNAFHQQYGRLPRNYECFDGVRLGVWCSERRSDYRAGKLSPTIIAAFKQHIPSWTWNAVEDAFQANLELLHKFAAAEGRMPTQKDTIEGKPIGRWVNKRRLQFRSGRMSKEQVAALEDVPGWWWSAEELFAMLEAAESEAAAAAEDDEAE